MSYLKTRLQQLEKKHAPKHTPVIRVEITEITEAHRQAQREAHARGEQYYIIEPKREDESDEQP